MGLKKNMPNHYLKLECLKLHFVCSCFAADFQGNPTDIICTSNEKLVNQKLCITVSILDALYHLDFFYSMALSLSELKIRTLTK